MMADGPSRGPGASESGGASKRGGAPGGTEDIDGARPPLECQRRLFSLPSGARYLNCAYMAPLPRPAEEAMVAGLRLKRHPTDIPPSAFFERVEEVRRRFGALLGGDAERVAIFPSVSYGISLCARNLPVERGTRIVLTREQFPGSVYAWRRLAEERGAEVVTVGPDGADTGAGGARARLDGAGAGRRWNEGLLDAIAEGTRVVCVPHVHWTDGTLFDLEEVGRRAREVGAALVIDATQSLGALPLDLEAIRPDAVIAATYKWLLGPYSMALGWLGERFDDGVPLEETWMAREGSQDFRRLVEYRDEYRPGSRRYDVGEVANFVLLPGVEASLGLLTEWGAGRIQAYCARVTRSLVRTARGQGLGVEDDRWRGHHLFGIRMRPDIDIDRLAAELERKRIAVSVRGSSLRVSPNVYNDLEDVAALEDVLASL